MSNKPPNGWRTLNHNFIMPQWNFMIPILLGLKMVPFRLEVFFFSHEGNPEFALVTLKLSVH